MSTGEILAVKNLTVVVDGKTVLSNVNLSIRPGEVVALTGVNGSGKSSLAMTLMGHTAYSVKPTAATKVEFDGKDLLEMSIDERARAGLFVVWQNPTTIPGVTVFSLAKTVCQAQDKQINSLVDFKEKLEMLLERVGLAKDVVGRSINDGFSGGEKKRLELFWLLLLKPKLVILDEVDSGLDVGGRAMVTKVIDELRVSGTAIIVISHYPELIVQIKPERVLELVKGEIKHERKEFS